MVVVYLQGGFLEYIFNGASEELFGVSNPKIEYTSKRNPDFRDVTLKVDGKAKLKFAAVRLQKIVSALILFGFIM